VIISSAPLRISFCGGGTDYKKFYESHGGAVIGASINQRVYVFINPLSKFSEENIRFTYRTTESVQNIDAIKHPVVRVALNELGIHKKINIATMSDIPGNSGLGSSSAFTIALISGLARFNGIKLENHELIELAYKLERIKLKESGGIQDYLHATYGSLRHYNFSTIGTIENRDILTPGLRSLIERRVVLIRIGESRDSAIHAQVTENAVLRQAGLRALHKNNEVTKLAMERIIKTSDSESQYQILADAVHQNWITKQIFQPGLLSNFEQIRSELQQQGLVAIKLCGAGLSGYLLAFFDRDVPHSTMNTESFLKFEIDTLGLLTNEI
jgi:D-glycero-alpha-D-manno-heptose-7-phosphate kinase